jgi:hypothetical protein
MPALKFRVLLDSIKDEEIFRDILINDDDNFESFYNCILKAFDFDENEMASFYVSDHEWNKGEEISLMDMSFGEEDTTFTTTMEDAVIRTYLESPKQRFILVHNFMDMWIFLIEMQEITSDSVDEPIVTLEVGKLTEELKLKKVRESEDLQFAGDILDDDFSDLNFDDDFDEDLDLDDEDFLNLDEFEDL